ncbi:MAG TPA: protein-L-isoaspartate(D-aspartate) O-methyltransferase [Planctomycetota bacterium]|nr:protein-L-isoaspartate(D-aspartate) O-methyltransferase [Planctomycetota bacterium]
MNESDPTKSTDRSGDGASPDEGWLERARDALLAELAREIQDPRVLEAIREVPRHRFVPEELRSRAYENRALPIGGGQTISQPVVVAMMTEALELEEGDRVLEIGTGSAYQAAILSRLAASVDTIERDPMLYESARQKLALLGYTNVTVHLGDGSRGLPEKAPFDGIIVTAGSPTIPQPLVDQLAPGGRLVVPVGDRDLQRLQVVRVEDGRIVTRTITRVVFVPLVGEFGWHGGATGEVEGREREGF